MKYWLEIGETLPPWAVFLCMAAIFAWLVSVFRKERRETASFSLAAALFSLRLAAFLILAAMILQVTYVEDRTPPETVIFLLDDSVSMSFPEGADFFAENSQKNGFSRTHAETRWESLKKLLADTEIALEKRLQARVAVSRVTLSEILSASAEPETSEISEIKTPAFPESPLGAAVRKILLRDAEPPKAIIFFTDGGATDEAELRLQAETAGKRNVILASVLFGSETPLPRVRLEVMPAGKELTAGETLNIPCVISAENLENRSVELLLFAAEKPETPRTLLTKKELLISAETQHVETLLNWTPPAAGEYSLFLEARVTDIPGISAASELFPEYAAEATYTRFLRDTHRLPISVIDRKYRVLLLWQKPSWEFRALQNLLAREKGLELETWLASAETGHTAQDTAARERFPSREEMENLDLIILGDISPQILGENALNDLAEWVRNKNSEAETEMDTENLPETAKTRTLLCIPGPFSSFHHWRGTALEKLLPFHPEDITFIENIPAGADFSPTLLGKTVPGMMWEPDSRTGRNAWETFPPIHRFYDISRVSPAAMILAELHIPAEISDPEKETGKSTKSVSERKDVKKSLSAAEAAGKAERKIPAVIFHAGKHGNLYLHTFDSSWRWRWRNDETAYRHYWTQTIRWLCRGAEICQKPLSETPETSQTPKNDSQSTDFHPPKNFPEPSAAFFSHSASEKIHPEFRRTTVNRELMAEIAVRTGGAVYGNLPECRPPRELPRDLLLSFQAPVSTDAHRAAIYEKRYSLWRHGGVLLLLSVLLFAQWGILRRIRS